MQDGALGAHWPWLLGWLQGPAGVCGTAGVSDCPACPACLVFWETRSCRAAGVGWLCCLVHMTCWESFPMALRHSVQPLHAPLATSTGIPCPAVQPPQLGPELAFLPSGISPPPAVATAAFTSSTGSTASSPSAITASGLCGCLVLSRRSSTPTSSTSTSRRGNQTSGCSCPRNSLLLACLLAFASCCPLPARPPAIYCPCMQRTAAAALACSQAGKTVCTLCLLLLLLRGSNCKRGSQTLHSKGKERHSTEASTADTETGQHEVATLCTGIYTTADGMSRNTVVTTQVLDQTHRMRSVGYGQLVVQCASMVAAVPLAALRAGGLGCST